MKTVTKYYVIDRIAESVIGSFEAISDKMAFKMYEDSIVKNEKLKYSSDQYALIKDMTSFEVPETFSEVCIKGVYAGYGDEGESKL